MKKYICGDQKFLSFVVLSDIDNFLKANEYLNPYVYIKETDQKPQFFITFHEGYDLIKFNDNYSYNENTIYIKDGNIYNLKRVILDLYSRLLEQKYLCPFYHASAVDKKGATIFLGDRGAGKTYNMIKKVDKGYNFISNDKIALVDQRVIGFPTTIGIRKKNLLLLKEYRERYIQDGSYNDILKEKNDTFDKVLFNISDFCKLFNCNITPNSKLNDIIYLSNKNLNEFMVNSVYEEQNFINKMIKVRK